MARWTSRHVGAHYQSTLRTNPFCPRAFDETRHNDDAQNEHDEECDFPKTDSHLFNLPCFPIFHTEIQQPTFLIRVA